MEDKRIPTTRIRWKLNREFALRQSIYRIKMGSKEKLNMLLLTVFSIFFFLTLLQPYLDGMILLPLVVIWFISAISIDISWLRKSKIFLMAIFVYAILIFFDGLATRTQTEIDNLLKSYVYSYSFILMGIFYACNYKRFNFKYYIYIMLIATIISSICTIIGLREYPTASRDLASGISSLTDTYKQMGIGGYAFTYNVAFIVAAIIFVMTKKTGIFQKLLIIACVVLFAYTIYKTDYTTAFLMMAMTIALAVIFMSGKNNILKILILMFVALIAFIFRVQLLQLLIGIIGEDNVISMRLGEFLEFLRPGSDVTFNRLELMKESFGAFFNNPLFGELGAIKTIGGHSDFVDSLGRYGLIGFIAYNTIFFEAARLQYKQFSSKKFKVYFIIIQALFLFLRVVNTVMGSQSIFGAVFVLSPMILLHCEQKVSISCCKIKFNQSQQLVVEN